MRVRNREIREVGIGGMGRRWDACTGLHREIGRDTHVSDFCFCTRETKDESVERVW